MIDFKKFSNKNSEDLFNELLKVFPALDLEVAFTNRYLEACNITICDDIFVERFKPVGVKNEDFERDMEELQKAISLGIQVPRKYLEIK